MLLCVEIKKAEDRPNKRNREAGLGWERGRRVGGVQHLEGNVFDCVATRNPEVEENRKTVKVIFV